MFGGIFVCIYKCSVFIWVCALWMLLYMGLYECPCVDSHYFPFLPGLFSKGLFEILVLTSRWKKKKKKIETSLGVPIGR